MSIQKTPPLGWPHTEAAKHYDQQTKTILKEATPPEPKKKRTGCCGGTLVGVLVILAVLGVVVAAIVGTLEEEGVLSGEPASAEDVYLDANPGWGIEASDYPDSDGTVQLVTWYDDLAIGRIVYMEPNEYADGGWSERELLPDGVEWSSPQFYEAFSEEYSSVRWAYAVSVEYAEGDTTGTQFLVTYSVWGEDSGEWSEFTTAPATFDGSDWIVGSEVDATLESTPSTETP